MAEKDFEYFNSSDVKIYPTARRGTFTTGENDDKKFTYDPEARLNTEYNTTNGFSKTPEKQSYVVENINTDDADVLKCVVGGYYFEIKNFNKVYLLNKPQYLIIETTIVDLINTTTDARQTQLLQSLETGSTETTVLDNTSAKFTGLAYTNKVSVATKYTYLQLFKDTDCTQLNQEAYLTTSLVKSGTGKHSIVGTFGFESSSAVLDPKNTTNINIGSGDYSITFGNANENDGDYSLVYGNNIVNSGDNNIIVTVNSTKNEITGSNNILIGEDIVASENQLILNKIKEVKIYNDNENVLDYSISNGFKLGENLVTISKTDGLVLKVEEHSNSEDTSDINLIKVNVGADQPLTLVLNNAKKAQLDIEGDIKAQNMQLSGAIARVTQITMADSGIINTNNGKILTKEISATQSHLGTADADTLIVARNARVYGTFSSCSVVAESAAVSGTTSVGNLKITQTATGISFGNGAKIKYDSTNKRLEIIC